MMSSEERYQYDQHFRILVDFIELQIREHKYTPTELRDAVMLAAIRYEYTHIKRTFILKAEAEIYGEDK